MAKFLDFDEAVSFLNTNPSTLYKWLQAGRVPAHKLGRQWRFVKEELEAHVAGRSPEGDFKSEIAAVMETLGVPVDTTELRPDALARALLWYNYDKGDYGHGTLHFQPDGARCIILHRTKDGMKEITRISAALFHALDAVIQKTYQPGREENSRRIFLARDDGTAMEARYLKIETATGPYATCRSNQRAVRLPRLEDIAPQAAQREKFTEWLGQPHGLIAISGAFGSGKTTTLYTLLEQAAQNGRLVFTLEDDSPYLAKGIHHVELAARNLASVEKQLGQILALGAEVIGIVIDSFPGLEPLLLAEAAHMAREGRLVLLQTTAPTAEAALAQLRKIIPAEDAPFIGVIWQVLVPKGKGRAAEYTFLRG